MKNFDICCLLLGILIFSLACQFYVVESFVGEKGRPVGVRPQRQGPGQANRQAPPQGRGQGQRQAQRQEQRQAQRQEQRQEYRQAQRQANRQAQRRGQAPRQIQPPPQGGGQGQSQKTTTAFNKQQREQIKQMVNNDSFIQNQMKRQHKKLHQDMKRIKKENTVS